MLHVCFKTWRKTCLYLAQIVVNSAKISNNRTEICDFYLLSCQFNNFITNT